MARGDQLVRQWSLLHCLQQGRRSRRSLAEEFGVSLRTIARDIDALSYFPIQEEIEGIDVFYSLLEGSRIPSLWLQPDEAAALVFARESITQALEGTPFRETFLSALTKIENTQKGHSYRTVRKFPDVFQVDTPSNRVIRRFEEEHLQALLQAALEQRKVRMTYFTASRQSLTERIIEPLLLYQSSYGFRLIAYCHRRKSVIFFNLNYIRHVEILEETFDLESRRFDLEQFLEQSFDGMRSDPVVEVKLHIKYPTAHWAKDRNYHPTQTLTEVEDGVLLTFRAGGLPAIAARVLNLGIDCIVLEPPELRKMVAERALATASLYPEYLPSPK